MVKFLGPQVRLTEIVNRTAFRCKEFASKNEVKVVISLGLKVIREILLQIQVLEIKNFGYFLPKLLPQRKKYFDINSNSWHENPERKGTVRFIYHQTMKDFLKEMEK